MSERPIECSECKRPAKIIYKEILGDTINCTQMCIDCPILQVKLHGEARKTDNKASQICCNNCGTSLESVQTGQPVGCTECYAVFSDFLVGEIIAAGAIPPALQKKQATERSQAIHIGKSPDKTVDITLSSRLASLNEALNDALKRENYEQAALLRDQIKTLTDKQQ
ncbi:MAG TPA: UvrB/UvrC motif-containing protein [Rhabdochlamydiaceae bacterium]|jgi:protein arginine kinase activator|nr:UvrB/UvrC motif-containing protein [Rhabdochlamydiaceae bacterium]